jgi:ferritin-like metal-binding protein YciE
VPGANLSMGKLDVQSTVTLVLNGEQTKTSLRDVTSAVNATRAALSRMNEADNPQLYRQRVEELKKLTEAQKRHREAIFGTNQEQKGFFADFKKGFSEISELAGKFTAGTLIYKGVSSIISGVQSLFEGAEQAYDEAQRSQTQLQTVVKSTGEIAGQSMKDLQGYQETLMNLTGVDDDVIAKGEEMLLTFTNIRGKIYERWESHDGGHTKHFYLSWQSPK